MKLEITIGSQQLMFIVVFVAAMAVVGIAGAYNPSGSGGNPAVMGHSSDEVMVSVDETQMSLQSAIDQGKLGIPTCSEGQTLKYNSTTGRWICSGTPPLKFEVYNPDTTTYACVEKDLEEYCGDEDGCTIRLLLQHETHGNDQAHIIDEHIYMEQTSLSNNHNAGIYGYTRQSGGGDYGWITGTTGRYQIFSPWDWVWAHNYRHDRCAGQSGNGPAFSNKYLFSFMSHPNVRATVIVYDSTGV